MIRLKSKDSVCFYDDDNMPVVDDFGEKSLTFDAIGVHVGDAAQTQFGVSLRYEPLDNVY